MPGLVGRSRTAGFWAATVSTPIATLLVAGNFFAELNKAQEGAVGAAVAIAFVLVSFRYFLRCQFFFFQPTRRVRLERLNTDAVQFLLGTHVVLVALTSINIAALATHVFLGLTIFILQATTLLAQWFVGFVPIFFGLGKLAEGHRKKFRGAHAFTVVIDLSTFALGVVFALSLFDINQNLARFSLMSAVLLFLFTVLEIFVHIQAEAAYKSSSQSP